MNLYEFATQPAPIDMTPNHICGKTFRDPQYCEHVVSICAPEQYALLSHPTTYEDGESKCLFSVFRDQELTEDEFRMFCLFVWEAAQS